MGNLCLTDVTSAGDRESIHLELFPEHLPCACHMLVVENTDKQAESPRLCEGRLCVVRHWQDPRDLLRKVHTLLLLASAAAPGGWKRNPGRRAEKQARILNTV